ncbi:cytochrome P450 4V2 [Trichonephila clavipes]|nr:cytochrome P450 4V2 [Trichonephila clavipes]
MSHRKKYFRTANCFIGGHRSTDRPPVSSQTIRSHLTEGHLGSKHPIVECGISVDGTWQRRGYSSMNGCVAALSVATGNVVDIEIMSSYCPTCRKISKMPRSIESETFAADHVCHSNFQGYALKIEAVGATRFFQRSIVKRGLKYARYYGKLSDSFIDRLQNFYEIAVRSNVGNLSGLQQNVIAALFHCSSSVKKPMHGQCPIGKDSWLTPLEGLHKDLVLKAPGTQECVLEMPGKQNTQVSLTLFPSLKDKVRRWRVGVPGRRGKELLKDTKMFEKSPLYETMKILLGTGLVTSSVEKWKPRRKLLNPCFNHDMLKGYFEVFNIHSRKLINFLKRETEKDYSDIKKALTSAALDIICETMLGFSIGAQEDVDSPYVKAVRMLSGDYREGTRYVKMYYDLARSAFNEKKKEYLSNNKGGCKKKRKALIDNLIKLHLDSQELSEEDALEEIVTFIMAGYETVAMSATWALFLIGLHPDVQEKLHEEIDKVFGEDIDRDATEDDLNQLNYLNCVLMESSRCYPVIPMFGRQALEDTVISPIEAPTLLVVRYELPSVCLENPIHTPRCGLRSGTMWQESYMFNTSLLRAVQQLRRRKTWCIVVHEKEL